LNTYYLFIFSAPIFSSALVQLLLDSCILLLAKGGWLLGALDLSPHVAAFYIPGGAGGAGGAQGSGIGRRQQIGQTPAVFPGPV